MRRELIAAPACALALLAVPAAAPARDANDNRIPDRWEERHRISVERDLSKRDFDRDGLRTRVEFRTGLDPRDADSDDDGVDDGDEVAGRIVRFDGGILTLQLPGAATVSGAVTPATEIECDDDDDAADARAVARFDDDDELDDEDDADEVDRDDDDERDDEDGGACALTPGTWVHEAELTGAPGAPVFEEIELED